MLGRFRTIGGFEFASLGRFCLGSLLLLEGFDYGLGLLRVGIQFGQHVEQDVKRRFFVLEHAGAPLVLVSPLFLWGVTSTASATTTGNTVQVGCARLTLKGRFGIA